MLQLNLPSFHYQIKNEGGTLYIYDELRKQYLVLTPEEWVRQHFIHFLMNEKGIPSTMLKQEAKLTYHKLEKWADILVYNQSLKPMLLIECKASTDSLNQDVFHQLITYNHVLAVPYLGVTNGLSHLYAMQEEDGSYASISALPHWETMKDRPSF